MAVVAGAAAPARADEGLTLSTDSTYAFDPPASAVHVRVRADVANVTTDRREGNVLKRLYYTSVTLPLPAGAVDVRATADDRPVEVTVTPVSDRVARAEVPLGPNLFAGQRRTVVVEYDLRGAPPRDPAFTRVNPAYASFVAYGSGDPGAVTVRVTVPAGFDVETLGDDVAMRVEGGTLVYEAIGIAAPDRWFVGISARDDGALVRTDVSVGDRLMAVESWPGDDEWAAFVRRNLDGGVPALERLIGRPWPLTARLSIVETVTPYLRGYAGWFLVRQNKIEVGEDLDDRTLLHELSHAWFNRDLFDARWVNEGMAEEFSARALGELGLPVPTPDEVDTASANRVTLEAWSSPGRRDDADDVEAWAYNASWSVVHRLVAEIGVERMAAVIAAADQGTQAYTPGADSTATTTDWRRLLDLLSEIGGSQTAEDLFRRYVVRESDLDDLDARAAARQRAVALAAAGGEWAAPAGIDRSLEAWDFAAVGRLADDATAVLAQRDRLAAAASAASLTPVSSEADYEAATADLSGVTSALARRQASVDTIVAARQRVARPRSFVERVGLLGRTPQDELDLAAAAFTTDDTAVADAAAARAVALVDTADDLGRQRVTRAGAGAAGGLVLLVGGTVLGVRRRRRRRRRHEAVVAPAPPESDLTVTCAPPADAVTPAPLPPPGDGLPPPDPPG